MVKLTHGVTHELLIVLPESEITDTPTYEIFDSTGTVLKSGNLTYVSSGVWKTSFKPSAFGPVVFKAVNSGARFDAKREEQYIVGGKP